MRSIRLFLLAVLMLSPATDLRAADDDETKLPAKAVECHIAGGGRYLVLRLKDTRALYVYDATTQKLTTLDVAEDNVLYAAGGDTVLVFLKEANELQTWSLTTGKMVKSKGFIDKANIQLLEMGHSRGDVAFLRMGRTQTGAFGFDYIVDTNELRISQIKYSFAGGAGGRAWDQSQVRANGDLTRLVDWSQIATPTNVAVLTKGDGNSWQYMLSYTALPGCMIPGDDGRVYTPLGNTIEPDPNYNPNVGGSPYKMTPNIKGKTLVPAIGAQFVLAVSREGGLTLYEGKGTEALAPFGDFPGDLPKADGPGFPNFVGATGQALRPEDLGPGAMGQGRDPLTLDRRICFAPSMDHIVFLPYSNDKIVQRKFDLKAALDMGGDEYLMVLSVPPGRGKGGAVWEYQMKTIAKSGPVKYELVKAPDGMTVNADGKLTWTPPKGVIGRAPVEVKGTDSKGKIIRQVFEVNFE